jgi:hypothetical protein
VKSELVCATGWYARPGMLNMFSLNSVLSINTVPGHPCILSTIPLLKNMLYQRTDYTYIPASLTTDGMATRSKVSVKPKLMNLEFVMFN